MTLFYALLVSICLLGGMMVYIVIEIGEEEKRERRKEK